MNSSVMKLSLNFLFIPLLILHTHKKLNGQGVERTYIFLKMHIKKKSLKKMETDQEDRQDNVWVIEQLGNLIYDQPTGYVWLDINYHPKNITSLISTI